MVYLPLHMLGMCPGASPISTFRGPQANFETPIQYPGIVLIHFMGPQFPLYQRPHQSEMEACVQFIDACLCANNWRSIVFGPILLEHLHS